MKFLAILLIIGASQCLIPTPVKSALKAGWVPMVNLACDCLVQEANKNIKFLPAGLNLQQFTAKINEVTKKSAIAGFNAMIDKTRRTGVLGSVTGAISGAAGAATGAVGSALKYTGAMVGGIAALGTKIIDVNVAGVNLKKAVGNLAGPLLRTALINSLCPSTVLLVKAAAASVGIVTLPACATEKVKQECVKMVTKIVTRRTLLRRLYALKSELENF
jgi:hypothetical protein